MSSKDFDKFIDGIEDGKLDVVKLNFCQEFLDKIIDMSENLSRGIHIACRNGHSDIVEYLLKEGCDIEAETTNGKRAIHFASMEGHVEIVRLLIAYCCDAEAETSNGERPIHYAAIKGHTEVIRILIENDCRLEPRDRDGNTPLVLAVMCDNEECLEVLLEAIDAKKAKPNKSPSTSEKNLPLAELIKQNYISTIIDPENGKTLLDLVLETKNKVLLDMIRAKPLSREELEDFVSINGMNDQSYRILEECILYRSYRSANTRGMLNLSLPHIVNRPSLFMGPTVLEMAVENNMQICTKQVIKYLVKPDESWERSKQIAQRNGFTELFDYITTRQNYLIRRAKVGYSRLHIAIFDNVPEMIEYILDQKILPIEIGDKTTGTPLSASYGMLYTGCIEVLEDRNASPDTTDRFNQSPLHVAIASGMFDCCDYLVDRMKDLELRDVLGFTVLDRARMNGYQNICDKLIARGAKFNDDPRITDGQDYGLPTF